MGKVNEQISDQLLLKIYRLQLHFKARYFVLIGGDLVTFHFRSEKPKIMRYAEVIKQLDQIRSEP